MCRLALPACPSHPPTPGPMDALHGVRVPRSCQLPLFSGHVCAAHVPELHSGGALLCADLCLPATHH